MFLKKLAVNNTDVEDNRVVQGMSNMLGRSLLVITSMETGARSNLFRPFKANTQLQTLTLGHIHDEHFVPMKRTGKRMFSPC